MLAEYDLADIILVASRKAAETFLAAGVEAHPAAQDADDSRARFLEGAQGALGVEHVAVTGVGIGKDRQAARLRRLRCVSILGGMPYPKQMQLLSRNPEILVATPGRLLDLLAHNALRLGDVDTLVLDEADRLLDQGFAEEINRLLALLPTDRQTLLLSATLPDAVVALADRVLRHGHYVVPHWYGAVHRVSWRAAAFERPANLPRYYQPEALVTSVWWSRSAKSAGPSKARLAMTK